MSTKPHITQQYVYKTANNIHVYKTCLKKAKKCTHVAAQQLCGILHIINPYGEHHVRFHKTD
jgi:hypothetical protein